MQRMYVSQNTLSVKVTAAVGIVCEFEFYEFKNCKILTNFKTASEFYYYCTF